MTRVLKPGGQLGIVVTDAGRLSSYDEVLDPERYSLRFEEPEGLFSPPVLVARKLPPGTTT